MLGRGMLAAVAVLMVTLMACGPTPAQVNNAGHEQYLGGDYAASLKSYQDAQGRAPQSGAPHYNTGNTQYRMEEFEAATESFDESLRHAAGDLRSQGFFNRGNSAFQRELYPEAVDAYKEALRMNPDDQDAKHNLELALLRNPPEDEQQQEEEEEEQDQEEQDQEEEEEEQEEEEQEQDEQDAEAGEQEQPITKTQARQILESVGEAAQTLQERRGQVLVSPKPPSEFDW